MPNVGRVRGRRAFSELALRGRTVRSAPLRVRYMAAPEGVRVGYAIGKKVGGAVERNRIRRRLRAAVSAATTPLTCGLYLISADPAASDAAFPDLVGAVEMVAAKVAE